MRLKTHSNRILCGLTGMQLLLFLYACDRKEGDTDALFTLMPVSYKFRGKFF